MMCIILALLSKGAVWAAAPSDWSVKDASIRFVVELTTEPSHKSAGYFVTIPHGGSLPGPHPEPIVVDEAGNVLASGILWHCKDTDCALVFRSPEAGDSVVIYFRGSKKLKRWTPQSGLTPSAIMCETHGISSKDAALKLGGLGVVNAKTRFINQAYLRAVFKGSHVPLAMFGKKPGGNAIYILSYIDVSDAGSTWIAPYLKSGSMEIAIDGKVLKQSKKSEKLGGTGGSVNLKAGLHRVELYGYNNTAGKVTGPMMFTWRTPKMTIDDLGGVRPDDLRYAGTSMCESRIIASDRVVKSGACRIRDINTRSGLVASFKLTPESIFWLPEEDALIAYTLKAWTKNNPEGSRYSWSFEQAPNALADGAGINWLFKGGKYTKVTLTVEAAGKQVSSSAVFYPHTDHESRLDDDDTRQSFKLACYTMLKSYADKDDPTVSWDTAMWNNFFRVLDLKGANALLEYIITQRWEFFSKKLEPAKKSLLQDVFLFSMGPRKPKEAIKWASKFSKDEFVSARTTVLKLKMAEILMYYLDDLDGAGRIIAPLLRDSGEGGEWAKIRAGDLAFLSRKLNAAIQRYGDVQGRAKASVKRVEPRRLTPIPSGPTRAYKKPKPAKERGAKKRDKQKSAEESKWVPMDPPPSLPAWKLGAIRDVAASENLAVLIEQGFYLEAFQALQSWERSFPMSKISGDYILREASLYRHLKDYKRARLILSAYCEQVDVSNFLPEAMNMIKLCMVDMNESDAAIAKYEKEIMRRTVFGGGED